MERQYSDMTIEELIDHALKYSSRISETDAVIELSQRVLSAQRALDATQARVKELEEGKGYLIRLWGLIAPQCDVLSTLVGLATQFDNYIAGQKQQLATLQAQVKELDKMYRFSITERNKLNAETDELTLEIDSKDSLIETIQAQLRQVEGERDHAKKMEAVQKEVADNQTWHVQTLRQLVAALPVPRGKVVVHPPCVGMIEGTYDVRIEWQEGNSFKSIRTAQFHVKENAEALAALLTYRATQDASTRCEP